MGFEELRASEAREGLPGYRGTIQCFDIIYIVWENIYTSVRIQVYYIIMMFAACLYHCIDAFSKWSWIIFRTSAFGRITQGSHIAYYSLVFSFKKGCCQLQAKVCARITG